MTVEIGALMGIVGLAISLASFYIGRQSSAKRDGLRDGKLDTDMKHIIDSITEIKTELKEANLSALKYAVDALGKQVDKQGDAITRLHKRVDDLTNK